MTHIDTAKVEEIIRHVAATEILPRFRNLRDGDIRQKKPGDFVTVADEAAEKIFSAALPGLLPGSCVVGEEAVAADSSVLQRLKGDNPVWVIDPVDGTYNFSHGKEKFGVLIALVQGGVTTHGWIFDAPNNRMVVAGRGAGVFLDGRRVTRDSGPAALAEMAGQAGGAQPWHFDAVRPLFRSLRHDSCAVHDYLAFLTGQADFILHINKVTPWDHAAANLAVAEAGGHVALDAGGVPYDPTRYGRGFSIVATGAGPWRTLHAAVYGPLTSQP